MGKRRYCSSGFTILNIYAASGVVNYRSVKNDKTAGTCSCRLMSLPYGKNESTFEHEQTNVQYFCGIACSCRCSDLVQCPT